MTVFFQLNYGHLRKGTKVCETYNHWTRARWSDKTGRRMTLLWLDSDSKYERLVQMAEIFPDLEEPEIIAGNQLNHCAVAGCR